MSEAEKPALVGYFTEARALKGGKIYRDWEQVCEGHKTMYEAMACQDTIRSAAAGGQPKGWAPDIAALTVLMLSVMKAMGMTVELRLMKETLISEEVEASS